MSQAQISPDITRLAELRETIAQQEHILKTSRQAYKNALVALAIEASKADKRLEINAPVHPKKARAEKWVIRRFLEIIEQRVPTREEFEALFPKLDISRATRYKYAIIDTEGKYRLTQEGRNALAKMRGLMLFHVKPIN